MPEKFTASVKVMRSFDYCHFEVVLGTTEPATLSDVDSMRKEAARLADKAVAQYKVAKTVIEDREDGERKARWQKTEVARIQALAESDRTPRDQAELKQYNDNLHRASRRYDYEDDYHYNDDYPEDDANYGQIY